MADPKPESRVLSQTQFGRQAVFVAFDTETTGLLAISNRLVEIAAVKFRLGSVDMEIFQSLINPERPVPEEVISIHGITDQMVANAPPASEVLAQFIQFCGPESILIAHNAPFDISFLASELQRAGMSFGKNTVIDTVDIYRRFYPGLPKYSLLALARHFLLAESQEHRALSDAQLVRQLFSQAVAKMPPIDNSADLNQKLTTYKIDGFLDSVEELPEKFADIKWAIKNNSRLEIVYTKPGEEPHRRIIRPISIQKMNSAIYIAAFCELVNAERTFRLDRISSFELVK